MNLGYMMFNQSHSNIFPTQTEIETETTVRLSAMFFPPATKTFVVAVASVALKKTSAGMRGLESSHLVLTNIAMENPSTRNGGFELGKSSINSSWPLWPCEITRGYILVGL